MKSTPLLHISRSINLFKKQLSQSPASADIKETFTPGKKGLLHVLNSYIHPPLPLTPRQKHVLLSQITTSFRKHLAADQDPTLNASEASTAIAIEDPTRSPLSQETQRHFAAVVNSPAFIPSSSSSSASSSAPSSLSTAAATTTTTTTSCVNSSKNLSSNNTYKSLSQKERGLINRSDLEAAEKLLRGLLSKEISPSPIFLHHNITRNDSSLALLVSLCRSGSVSALSPPTEKASLKNWLVAGILLSNHPIIPLRWTAHHLYKRDYVKASALIWALIQTWLRLIGDTGATECFLSLMGFPHSHAEEFLNLAPMEGPLLRECRRLLVSPSAKDSRMLFKISKQLFQRLKHEDARRRLVQAIEIWNPAPHNLALTAHLSLKYCDNYKPGVDYLVALGELGPRDYALGEDDISHNSFRFRLELCLRILGAIAKTGHIDLLAEMIAIIRNRLRLCPDVSVAREVLEQLGNKNILQSIKSIRALLEMIHAESFTQGVIPNDNQDISFLGLES